MLDKVILTNNVITKNSNYGLFIRTTTNSNIFNNKLNNTVNTYFYDANTVTWNIASTTGPNIVGGPSIGGNYWGKPDRTGFSDTATDTNLDGFADSAYTVTTGNIDNLPLVTFTAPTPVPTTVPTTVPPTEPLIVNFNVNPSEGTVPFNTQFTDLSTGTGINSWFWEAYATDVAAPTYWTSTLQNPQPPTVLTPGTYTVNLTVSNGAQTNKTSRPASLIAHDAPLIVGFSAAPLDGTVPLNVQFTDLSAGPEPVNSWIWEIYNQSSGTYLTSTAQNPQISLTIPGRYNVNLTVTDGFRVNKTARVGYIRAREAPLVADFIADTTLGYAPMPVTFTDLSTGNPSAWNWGFGDGGSSSQNPSHTYTHSGVYTVSLTSSKIVNGNIVSNTTVKPAYIFVRGEYPHPAFSMSLAGGEAPLYEMFQDISTGEIEQVTWDFGDGSPVISNYYWWIDETYPVPPAYIDSMKRISHTYYRPGNYQVTFTAYNKWGDAQSQTQTVQVMPASTSKIYFSPDFTAIELGSAKPQYITANLLLSPYDQARGFSGYTMDLTTNSRDGNGQSEFTSLTFPQWATLNSGTPSQWPVAMMSIKAADINSRIGPGQETVPLGTVSVNAMDAGSVELSANVLKLNDKAGGELTPMVYPADILVYANVQPFPGSSMLPMDTDNDHLYEDVNGNSAKDFADVAMYFQNMEDITAYEPVPYFDYNRNGRIDFNDVILLFQMQ